VEGKPIEILFGALAMKQWGIRPVPDEEKLDLSHYPNEFAERSSDAVRDPREFSVVRSVRWAKRSAGPP
jgi:hypothetical protein